MAMEEMAELQKELCKHARGKENRKEIAEEIADVRIMLDQMAILHDCEELAGKFKEQKIERLGKLIRRKKGAEEGRSNADRIRAMDNGELAMLLCSADFCECCKYEQGAYVAISRNTQIVDHMTAAFRRRKNGLEIQPTCARSRQRGYEDIGLEPVEKRSK